MGNPVEREIEVQTRESKRQRADAPRSPGVAIRLTVGLVIVGALTIVGMALFRPDFRERSANLEPGMTRTQVEEKLGPPAITLRRSGGRGETSAWVDQLWQVTVHFDTDGRLEYYQLTPSDSVFRRTTAWVMTLL
ncbi:MAG: hypothetical protein KDA80_15930 [Planctomycetaceae bacterium]|nr:hypothetical protein [Planctomycetaceae bacterium]